MEAQVDFPGMIKLPPKIREAAVKFYTKLFLTQVYENAKKHIKELKRNATNSQKKFLQGHITNKDIEKIRMDVSEDLWASGEKYDKDEFEKRVSDRIAHFKTHGYHYKHRLYMSLLDLIKYLEQKGVEKKALDEDDFVAELPLDLTGWGNYGKPHDRESDDWHKNIHLIAISRKEASKYGIGGKWSHLGNSVTVALPDKEIFSVKELHSELAELVGTIEHELHHMLHDLFLRPRKLTRDDWEAGDTMEVPGWDYDNRDGNSQERMDQTYYATRTEYLPQLRSAVGEFKRELAWGDKDPMKLFRRMVVGSNDFAHIPPDKRWMLGGHDEPTNRLFKALKKYRPAVWKQAASDFYKELDRMGLLKPQKRVSAGSSSFIPTVEL